MIFSYPDWPGGTDPWPEVEEIFFLSVARRSFASPGERARYFARWTGYYRAFEPEQVLLFRAQDGRLAGYLTGCRDSAGAIPLYREIEGYALFEDLFATFPAHFHVNCHPAYRRRGIGRALITRFLDICRQQAIAGAHLVTALTADNVAFYRRCGFHEAARRAHAGQTRLFLARPLA